MFVPAAVALDPQKALLQQTALQVILKFLAHETRKVTTGTSDLLNKARVVLGDDGVQNGPFRAMTAVGRWSGKR